MNILIVDDKEANRKSLRAVLEAEGYSVRTASNGLEALDILDHEEVHAVISDVLMPSMDGYQLCYEIRRNDKLCDTPFIVYTTSFTSLSDEGLALGLGADEFLRQPAPTPRILAAVRRATSRRMVGGISRPPRDDGSTASPPQSRNRI